jgi:O-6-methylguanine DNA methyltransferase
VARAFEYRVWRNLQLQGTGKSRGKRKSFARRGRHHANPIVIIIPCHRVIGANGTLTGYGGGLDKKTFLLELEKNISGREYKKSAFKSGFFNPGPLFKKSRQGGREVLTGSLPGLASGKGQQVSTHITQKTPFYCTGFAMINISRKKGEIYGKECMGYFCSGRVAGRIRLRPRAAG